MKKNFTLVIAIVAIASCTHAQGIWTQKASYGKIGRERPVGFSIGNKGYIGTGSDGYGNFMIDFWEYDPDFDIWTQKADFGGVARYASVSFVIDGKGYVGTGFGPGIIYYKDFWEYDPTYDTWTQKADVPGTSRCCAVGFSIGDKGYVGTGEFFDGINGYSYTDFWEYDPLTDNWTQKADFAGGVRSYATGMSIGNKGYLGTGEWLNDFWEYDPLTDTWTQKADFGGSPRALAIGFSIQDKGYLGAGLYVDSTLTLYNFNDLWEYNSDVTTEIPAIANGNDTKSLSVFPNPTAGPFTLSLTIDNKENGAAKIEVINSLGQVVHSENAMVVNGKLQQVIHLNDLEGIYLVKVTIGNHVYSMQVNYLTK